MRTIIDEHQDLLTLLSLAIVPRVEVQQIANTAAATAVAGASSSTDPLVYERVVWVAGDEGVSNTSTFAGARERPFVSLQSAVDAIAPSDNVSAFEALRVVIIERPGDYSTGNNLNADNPLAESLALPSGRWLFLVSPGVLLPGINWFPREDIRHTTDDAEDPLNEHSNFSHALIVAALGQRNQTINERGAALTCPAILGDIDVTAVTDGLPDDWKVTPVYLAFHGVQVTTEIDVNFTEGTPGNPSSGAVGHIVITDGGDEDLDISAASCTLELRDAVVADADCHHFLDTRSARIQGAVIVSESPETAAERVRYALHASTFGEDAAWSGPAGSLVVDRVTRVTAQHVPLAGGATLVELGTDARFFDETATQVIHVATTGNDVTGDGTDALTPYASVNRALRDIPSGWTADVEIRVAAGTYAGNQTWSLPSLPGPKLASSGTGRVAVVGAVTETALTSGGAGVAVAGKLAQADYTFDAFAGAITDGSHFIREGASTFLYGAFPLKASASPTLRVVTATTTAFTTPMLAQWATVFSGAVRWDVPALGTLFKAYVNGVSFTSSFTASGVTARGCKFATTTTCNDVSFVGCTFAASTTTLTGSTAALNALTNCLWVAGSLALHGLINSLSSCVWRGAPSAAAKLALGGISATITTALLPAWLRSLALCDFEGTGNAVRVVNGAVHSGGSSAACTVAITGGAALIATDGARLYGAAGWAWTGTADAPSALTEGAALVTSTGFAVTNGGNDITVGELAAQAIGTQPTTAPVQLCRFT